MATHRSSNLVTGYLVKTAQCFSTFQRKQFYRRYYELDLETKQMKVYEKRGGQTKDITVCNVVHVAN